MLIGVEPTTSVPVVMTMLHPAASGPRTWPRASAPGSPGLRHRSVTRDGFGCVSSHLTSWDSHARALERVYVDHGLTGTNRARPGLREAMAACRAGDVL